MYIYFYVHISNFCGIVLCLDEVLIMKAMTLTKGIQNVEARIFLNDLMILRLLFHKVFRGTLPAAGCPLTSPHLSSPWFWSMWNTHWSGFTTRMSPMIEVLITRWETLNCEKHPSESQGKAWKACVWDFYSLLNTQ